MNISIRKANIEDMEVVATLDYRLLAELRSSDMDPSDSKRIHDITRVLFAADSLPVGLLRLAQDLNFIKKKQR